MPGRSPRPVLILKGCPRCNGDLEVTIDYGEQRSCIQCGFVQYASEPLPLVRHVDLHDTPRSTRKPPENTGVKKEVLPVNQAHIPFARRLQRVATARGLTPEEVGERLRKVDKIYRQGYVTQRFKRTEWSDPNKDQLHDFANALGVPVEELLESQAGTDETGTESAAASADAATNTSAQTDDLASPSVSAVMDYEPDDAATIAMAEAQQARVTQPRTPFSELPRDIAEKAEAFLAAVVDELSAVDEDHVKLEAELEGLTDEQRTVMWEEIHQMVVRVVPLIQRAYPEDS